MRQKGDREWGTGNQIFSGVLIFDESFGTAIQEFIGCISIM
ncbi:hypothetical protein CKA32_005849 [Geitlerinema sp. FC II]|nr:hypothetical protein CKA32_005849 [Geitlerinema sp. FC II]